ncbi:MAG: hypothetical protein RLZZ157_66 [Pseudomonadota bacterium]|jgi:hypothetical protein
MDENSAIDPNATDDDAPANPAPSQETGAPAPYRPEGLPDHLAGDNDQATIDKLFKSYSGARAELSTRGVVPETVDGYELKFEGEVPEHIKTLTADDPAIKMARELALKHKMTPAQFGFVTDFLGEATKAGMIDAPLDLKAEMAAFGGEDAFEKARGAIRAQVETLKARGVVGDAEMAEFDMMTSTAAGLKLVAALRGGGASALNVDGGDPAGAFSLEDVKARMADDRYSTRSPKYDHAFREQTSNMLKQLEARGALPRN